jgi:spermidine synthase
MKRIKFILFVAFFFSGLSGLIYESVWSHYIKLVLGHAAYAQTLVLMIFMGGMALGAWAVSRVSGRLRNPLLWYAIVEGIIGIFGIIFHEEFLILHHFLFDLALANSLSPLMATLIKWTVSTLMLMPQAILLGTTFPLMSAAIIRLHSGGTGRILGMLYFTNSIGATFGVLLSGFVLIQLVGLPGTSLTAGFINILLASGLWLLSKNSEFTGEPQKIEPTDRGQRASQILILVAALTGTASFFYEIGWIRMLSLVLSSSTQAFELMLSAFIAGLAMGSYFIRNRIDKIQSPGIYLGWIQIIMGLLAVATLPLYVESFSWMSFLFSGLSKTLEGYSLFNISSQFIALLVMFPATFMAGMTLPLLSNTLLKSGGKESAIGVIYSANTLGSIIGVVLAIHVVMPLLGVKSLIISGSLIDIALGIVLLKRFSTKVLPKSQVVILSVTFIAMILFSFTPFNEAVLSSGVYRSGKSTLESGDTLSFYQDGKTSSTALINHADGSISIRTNGKSDAVISPYEKPYAADEITMVMLAMVPLAMNPEAKNVANIGLGSGLTTHVLLTSSTIDTLDTIEIEYSMVKAAKGFGKRVERAFNDPRSTIYIDDAKSFFSRHKEKYDIIISEPSNPWISGVSSLFTQEFYDHVKTNLSQDGVFAQWLQLYEIDIKNVSSVISALAKSFKSFQLYNTDNSNLLIIASNGNLTNKLSPWIFSEESMRDELSRVAIESVDDIEIRYLGDRHTLLPFFLATGAPVNSDYYPYLAYQAPKSRYLQANAGDISWMHLSEVPVINWINNKNQDAELSGKGRYFDVYNKSKIALKIVAGDISGIPTQKLRFSARVLENMKGLTDHGQETTYLEAAQIVAAAVNPYLSKPVLEKYWHNMRDRAKQAKALGYVLSWLDLHFAISQRDAGNTINQAKSILYSGITLSVDQYRYLETAILTAHITNGDFVSARQFLTQRQLLKQTKSMDNTLKLLVSLANSGA